MTRRMLTIVIPMLTKELRFFGNTIELTVRHYYAINIQSYGDSPEPQKTYERVKNKVILRRSRSHQFLVQTNRNRNDRKVFLDNLTKYYIIDHRLHRCHPQRCSRCKKGNAKEEMPKKAMPKEIQKGTKRDVLHFNGGDF